MPPKKSKPREGNGSLPESTLKTFPFLPGDEVEMKSFESGYRGAWFRVQIKKLRMDRKGNTLSTMAYRDFTDQREEEISVFERDPANDNLSLMLRPVPPPFVKECKFNKSVQTKMCVVYRDEWEVGDLVDWWYHSCWWSAKVISFVGDGKFQLVCPAPPSGEGGEYVANSRDMRPSLKWSIAAQWTAPPSKEAGKMSCARIVRFLDRKEVKEFSFPNQDSLPRKRGRPRLNRLVSPSTVSQRAAPLIPDERLSFWNNRRARVLKVTRLPLTDQDTSNRDPKVPQKRGRPRKIEGEEAAKKRSRPIVIKIIHPRQESGTDRLGHILSSPSDCEEQRVNLGNPPESWHNNEIGEVETYESGPDDEAEMDVTEAVTQGSMLDDELEIEVTMVTRPEDEMQRGEDQASILDTKPVGEMRKFNAAVALSIRPENEVRRGFNFKHGSILNVQPDHEKRKRVHEGCVFGDVQPTNETGKWFEHKSILSDTQPATDEHTKCPEKANSMTGLLSDNVNRLEGHQQDKAALIGRQTEDECRQRLKQKRTVHRLVGNVNLSLEDQASNGHCEDAKRWKLEHTKRSLDPDAAGVESLDKQTLKDQFQDGKKRQEWTGDLKDTVAADYSSDNNLMMGHAKAGKKLRSVDANEVDSKPMLISDIGDVVVKQMLEFVPRGRDTLPDLAEGKESSVDQVSEPESDLEIQKGEQPEVFISNPTFSPPNVEDKVSVDLTVEKADKDALDLKILNAYEEAFADDIRLEGKKSSLAQDISAFARYKGALPHNICLEDPISLVTCQDISVVQAYEEAFADEIGVAGTKASGAQGPASENVRQSQQCGKALKIIQVSSLCEEISPDTKSSNLQERRKKKANKLSHNIEVGTESSSLDTISSGGSPNSLSGRTVNICDEVAMKDNTCSHNMISGADEEGDSGSSLDLGSSHDNTSRKSGSATLHPSDDRDMKNEKSDKNELFSLRKRIRKPVVKHKISLSRKLVDQARKETSAKRRSSRSTWKG